MASISTKVATAESILKPSIILKGHGNFIKSISYFPDGQRMVSGSDDDTARQWDLKAGKEIEEARDVYKGSVYAVAVSRDGRWVVTGGDWNSGEVKACEVATGIVKTFKGHSDFIDCIDISMDNTLLASGAGDKTAWIWNLDTGKLVAGPFQSVDWVGAVRFSPDSKKLAVKSSVRMCLEIWDVQSQKLNVKLEGESIDVESEEYTHAPVFWTNSNKSILAAFSFTNDNAITIYEFDASTLEIVGTPFEGHNKTVKDLALSFDGIFLVSAARDDTIKFWAFESRQLLASFNVQNLKTLVLSPDSCQLAYTTYTKYDHKICICNTPPDVLAQASTSAYKKPALSNLLNPDATRRPTAGHRRPPISATGMAPRPPITIDPQQPTFLRLSRFLSFSRANAVPQLRDPLVDVPATLPLPFSLSGQTATRFNNFEINYPPPPSNGAIHFLRQRFSFLVPRHSHIPVVEVAPGRKVTRLAAAKLPEYRKVDDTRHLSNQQATVPQENDTSDIDSLPDVHWCKAFLCYYSCRSHGRLRMPPRWRLERVDIPRQDDATNGGRSGAHGRS